MTALPPQTARPETPPPPPRRRKRRRRGLRRHPVGYPLLVLAVLVVLSVGWLVMHALSARQQLQTARTEITLLRQSLLSGNQTAAAADLAAIQQEATAADRDTHDPLWTVAAALPVLGSDVAAVRDVAASVHALAGGPLPALVSLGRSLSPDTLRTDGSTVNIALVARTAPALAGLDTQLAAALQRAEAIPSHFLVGPLARSRSQFVAELASLSGTVDDAARFARIAPGMLGASGPQRYFVALENDAESRGTGGLVGAFAVLTATDGHIVLSQVGSDDALADAPAPVVDLGGQFTAQFGGYESTQAWKSSNDTPDFPDAAAIWAGLWQRQTGERLAGAFAVEPEALARILAATGPAPLPGGGTLTSTNAVRFLESTLYALFPQISEQDQRKVALVAAERSVFAEALSGAGGADALVQALAASAGTGELLLWSSTPAQEAVIAPTPLSGQVSATRAPYDLVSVVNDGGDKLDYYLHRSVAWSAGSCRAATRPATVTVTLTNAAPLGLPPYVTVREDTPLVAHPYAQTRLLVSVYATAGSQLLGVTLNGAPSTVSVGEQFGHPVYTADLMIDRGASATLRLALREPTSPGPAVLATQPLINPQATSVHVPTCR